MNQSSLSWVAAVAGLALGLAGCASHGNDVLRTQDANAVNQNIVDGKTTRSEVERIYGPPNETSFANAQSDIWIYRWSRATAQPQNFIPYVGAFVGGADVQKKELVILFNDQNVVTRHSMRDSTDAVRRNLSAASAPAPSAGQISTSPAPQVASAPPAAAASPAPIQTMTLPAAATLVPGSWTCGVNNVGNSANPRYTLNFVIAPDRTISIVSYGNAPATVVKSNPLTFTAVNPRGSRLTTFAMKPDNSIVITGPGLNDPTASFHNEGTCVSAASGVGAGNGSQTSAPIASGQSRSRL